jgi:predicted glycoside hydrolase/deacetylase ChbG (UPF0249 family)
VSKLIVNADDFGLTAGVNRAIIELHATGRLTSATLMATAQATAEAIQMARTTPSLGVGCHVVLVDGAPLLSPTRDVPHLADPITGRFRAKLSDFLFWLYGFERDESSARVREREIEAEATAQINALIAAGVRLTHIDTHKHTHMFPAVLRPLLRAARAAGVRVVRNPFEPVWSVRATSAAPWLRRFEVNVLRRLEKRFKRIVAEEGFATTDGALGVLATGTLNTATVSALLQNLPAEGVFELVSHPGFNDADLARAHTRLLEARNRERAALDEVGKPAGVELISYAALGNNLSQS